MSGSVVVTGANGQVGRALLTALADTPWKTVALCRSPTKVPADLVISNWLINPQAPAVITQAQVVVHLAGTLQPLNGDYQTANRYPTQVLAQALEHSQCQRIIFLSFVGTTETSPNAYLATKAEAEAILKNTQIPLTIFRCSHIIGPPTHPGPTARSLISPPGKPIRILGTGENRVAPILLQDVVHAILAAITEGISGTYDLVGPEIYTINALAQLLNQPQTPKIQHFPAWIARLLPWIIPALSPALVDIMLNDSLGESDAFKTHFDLQLTPLSSSWSPNSMSNLH